MDKLSESNFLVYAMNNYDSPICTDLEEFNSDLNRIKYIIRCLRSKEINVQLILNHLIVLYNVFGNNATNMIMFKIERDLWKYLIPFLVYLNRLDEQTLALYLININLDNEIISKLQTL